MAPDNLQGKEKENQSHITLLASKRKKEKNCTKAFFLQAVGFVPGLLPHISKCSEYIPNSHCQVKMKTFSV